MKILLCIDEIVLDKLHSKAVKKYFHIYLRAIYHHIYLRDSDV